MKGLKSLMLNTPVRCKNKIIFLIIGAILQLNACATFTSTSIKQRYLELTYQDFGPPALATDLLGSEWWQWNPHGDPRPRQYDVHVIVYRDITENEVHTRFPINEATEKDYRYLPYSTAMTYLNANITALVSDDESVVQEIRELLIQTRREIVQALGD
ncbi:hypothetical protein EUZ85_15975 [Hahella sp. KA22]|uniref:hypothetical protein n=1 Tax=Hahella sp. KA22 TaxID=1628392 RepID=UPI000FDEC7DE|nr:hypothetical protein [Hahella sp. KA22]AZZ92141.1 hypothetical protein ENC22_13410 [Hahella sp. KA22]QAY55512.1 hypothetical protein EUZ85_15975 [Hahella sp. KA22]